MKLPSIFNFTGLMISETYINEVLEVNEEIREFGLELTAKDVTQIINARNKVLYNYGRVELSYDVTKKIIKEFGSSFFVNNENYISIFNEMNELFYYIKNETEDKIGDDNLIYIMKDLFDHSCGGSVELLMSNLEEFARNFRKKLE